MKFFMAFAALAFLTSASAYADIKVVCMVNTYSADGSNFKNLMTNSFDLKLGQRTEVYRSATAVYSVIAQQDKDTKGSSSLFVEITKLKGSNSIAAANADWLTGSPGAHRVTVYTTAAEPKVKTMLYCE